MGAVINSPKEIMIFDSRIDFEEIESNAKYYLDEHEAETYEEGERMAYESAQFIREEQWDFIKSALEESEMYFIEGLSQKWCGISDVMTTVTVEELLEAFSKFDEVVITETPYGKMTIKNIHHDGTSTYQVYEVNQKGIDRYERLGKGVGTYSAIELLTKNVRLRKRLGWI